MATSEELVSEHEMSFARCSEHVTIVGAKRRGNNNFTWSLRQFGWQRHIVCSFEGVSRASILIYSTLWIAAIYVCPLLALHHSHYQAISN